jgi:antitoxin ParD1/3/4
MNVSLTRELEQMVQEKVHSGLYSSASEVIRAALRLLQEREQLRRFRMRDLHKDIAVGLEQAGRGDVAPLDMKAIKAKARSRRKAVR